MAENRNFINRCHKNENKIWTVSIQFNNLRQKMKQNYQRNLSKFLVCNSFVLSFDDDLWILNPTIQFLSMTLINLIIFPATVIYFVPCLNFIILSSKIHQKYHIGIIFTVNVYIFPILAPSLYWVLAAATMAISSLS